MALKEFDTLEELATYVGKLSEASAGYLFFGHRVEITKGKWRYLRVGDKCVPTFAAPTPGEADLSAGLGYGDPKRGASAYYRDTVDRALAEERGADEPPDLPPVASPVTPVLDTPVLVLPDEEDYLTASSVIVGLTADYVGESADGAGPALDESISPASS